MINEKYLIIVLIFFETIYFASLFNKIKNRFLFDDKKEKIFDYRFDFF